MFKSLRFSILILLCQCSLAPGLRSQSKTAARPLFSNELDTVEMLTARENSQIDEIEIPRQNVQSLHLGMRKSFVRSQYGQPLQVEVAGNPTHGTERWTYEKQVNSIYGQTTQTQIIYFEQDSVVGWETR